MSKEYEDHIRQKKNWDRFCAACVRKMERDLSTGKWRKWEVYG